MRDEVLFWKYEWSDVTRAQQEAARKDADRLTDSDFKTRSSRQIVAELCERYSLEPPVLDPENITVKQREIEIDVSHNRRRSWSDDRPHYVKGTAIDVRLPFTGDSGMFSIKPNTWTTSIPRGRVEGNSIVFSISGTDLSAEKVKSEIVGSVSEIQKWLDFQSDSVRGFPEELARVVKQAVEAREAKLNADNDLVSNLGFRVE